MGIHILVVDDEASVRYTLCALFEELSYRVSTAENGIQALTLLRQELPDLMIIDLAMPQMGGMTLLEEAKKIAPTLPVIVITAHGSERKAVDAMKQGAWNYLKKPFDIDELQLTVEQAIEKLSLHHENIALRAQQFLSRPIIYRSKAMDRLMTLTYRVAKRPTTVLITGHTGTGKELIATALHEWSEISEKPFVTFNVATLPAGLAESQLFGHEKGAFTGAHQKHKGVFSQAHQGTLFLDEVGELPLELQAKLLRVLQEGEIQPLGSSQTQKVQVRIIAATHRDLQKEVQEGRFREDLYYRLNVVELRIPPLSERPEDLSLLINHFVSKYKERFSLDELRIAPEVSTHLLQRSWPGNVRELENTIERLLALSDGIAITEADLQVSDHKERVTVSLAQDPKAPLRQRVTAFEASLIKEALENNQYNQSATARDLQISRGTLIDKMNKYQLKP